jgi:hypothetical protein
VIAVDQRYNLSEFDDPTYICGSAPGSDDEGRCNPTYGQAIARTLPTSVRFAVKLGF